MEGLIGGFVVFDPSVILTHLPPWIPLSVSLNFAPSPTAAPWPRFRIQLNTAGYFLVATLVLTLVWAVKRNFVADRIFGWSLVAIYAVSLGTAVALEIAA